MRDEFNKIRMGAAMVIKERVRDVSSLDSLDVPARLDEFREMSDGWLEGYGVAPSRKGLDWLSAAFDAHYSSDTPLPYTYPTEEGGIRMEWSMGKHAMILEIDLDDRAGEWLWFDRNSDADCERRLDLDSIADWNWLSAEIASKFGALHRRSGIQLGWGSFRQRG